MFSSLLSLHSYYNGAKTVIKSTNAYPSPSTGLKYQMLNNIIEEMKIASGLPMPNVYIIPDPDPNAFTTGINPDKSYIAVTEGLLEKLSREELQAVVAHEMCHIKNYDIRLMTMIAALVGAIVLLSDFAVRGLRFRGSNIGTKQSSKRREGGPLMLILFIVWFVGIILAPLISRLLAMAVSRRREYLADASAAELTRNPLALASALEKIEKSAEPTKSIKKGSAHLCIVNPLGRKVNEMEGLLADLFATHPPISKRIEVLKQMAYQIQ